ncbi:DNA cytosine methyltransferase [Microbispora sp. NBC_01189]|uniref:DNA cytosine methyltransferase n=1 Tax=Microbispora sp. NBC_01189 TaxID=2903583 RepID=UPI002E161D91|nr:DNA cytosine methyltransferase [Microbispora sp. NBC_01189]
MITPSAYSTPTPVRVPNGLRVLDVCCCAGGAAMGYHRAGFDVTGVDIAPQPNYPFTFHRADAIEFIRAHGREFDFIHVSPPCQADCTLTAGTNQGRTYPRLLPAVRAALIATGRPWVIEQPIGKADMRRDLLLCGLMFGLQVFRHRQFELHGIPVPQPDHPNHRGHRVRGWRHGAYHNGDMIAVYGDGGGKGSITEWQTAMGITWTNVRREIAEAIPPAYTEHIGRAVANALRTAGQPTAAGDRAALAA